MFDCHCHSIFSDGELIPAELVRRVEAMGYSHVAITDHADPSNLDFIVPRMVEAAAALNGHYSTTLLPGIELTHCPPGLIASLARRARELGAVVVVCHGETVVEPVKSGTNRAALEADIDILAHPGFISDDDAELAAKKGIFLELSGGKGHCLTNGHVAAVARRYGARLIVNSDGHAPDDFMSKERALEVAKGAGLGENEVDMIFKTALEWLNGLSTGHGGLEGA